MGIEPTACILGTGRSGSGYVAAVLRAAGVPCGHEEWWGPDAPCPAGLVADSSWCALPAMLHRPVPHVFLQVRDPLKVVASLVASPDWGPYVPYRAAVGFASQGDPVKAAMALYVGWNALCESVAGRWWRVEDIKASDLLAVTGPHTRLSQREAVGALTSVPCDFNHHDGDLTLGWDDLPQGPEFDALRLSAHHYGYIEEP